MVFESVFRSNFHKATGKLKHAPPRPHLFQLQQAKLFGAQGSFRPAFNYTLPYITARLLRMVLRLWRKHWAANLRKASGSGMAGRRGKPDHRGIHFWRRAKGGGRDFAQQLGGGEQSGGDGQVAIVARSRLGHQAVGDFLLQQKHGARRKERSARSRMGEAM